MQLKLILITKNDNKIFYFNDIDSHTIISRCSNAEKKWTNALCGFFINASGDKNYAAISIKDEDNMIESMEYTDLDTGNPEFPIDANLLSALTTKPNNSEITLAEFETIFSEIVIAPVRARRWVVYNEIMQHYATAH